MTDSLLVISRKSFQSVFIVTHLPASGFIVNVVTDFTQALEVCGEHGPDLILVETPLKDDAVLSLCAQLRRLTRIPIVLFGHQADEELWATGVSAGADFYLVESWETSVKIAMLKAVLRRYRWNNR